MTKESQADHYLTVAGESTAETKVKGSRFVAEVHPARDESTAKKILQSVATRDHTATHHCSAWRVGLPEDLAERFDDDGEPSGTAGRPLLGALQSGALFEVVVVATRWYGGTKLGTGGLARAYGEAAAMAVAAASRRTVYREEDILIRTDYDHVGAVEALLGREAARIRRVDRDYGAQTRLRVRVLRGDRPRFLDQLREATAGTASCETRTVERGQD
jgi:uncharacterized YigZ family protein